MHITSAKLLQKLKKVLDIFSIYLYTNKGVEKHTNGILAQLGEHLPYKQRVTGSSPVGPILYGGIAQLARAYGSYP